MNNKINELYIQCILDKRKKVCFQNSLCIQKCGDMIDQTCSKGCQEHISIGDFESTQYLKKRLVHNEIVDISVFKKNGLEIVNIYPLATEETKDKDFSELTKRENEIASLVMAGYSNNEIESKLKIKKSTLKTHINHIYQKVGKIER